MGGIPKPTGTLHPVWLAAASQCALCYLPFRLRHFSPAKTAPMLPDSTATSPRPRPCRDHTTPITTSPLPQPPPQSSHHRRLPPSASISQEPQIPQSAPPPQCRRHATPLVTTLPTFLPPYRISRAAARPLRLLNRQEQLELRRQLLLRVQAVGEVDSGSAGDTVSTHGHGARRERLWRGRERALTSGCGSWRGSEHGASRCSWYRRRGA